MLSRLKPKEVETLLGVTGHLKTCVICFKTFHCTGDCPVKIPNFDGIKTAHCRCSHCSRSNYFFSDTSRKTCFRKCFLLEFNSSCMDGHPFKKRKPNHK